LYIEVSLEELEPTAPDEYSIDLARATPIKSPLAVPLVRMVSSYNSKVLNAVLSPLINVTSGVPKTFVIFAKLPKSKVDTPALTVSKSLALLISLIVGATF